MTVRLLETDVHLLNMHTRMPFRYGIATMTTVPHLLLRVRLEVDGRGQWGIAADHLPPKWFTKQPEAPFRQDIDEMLAVAAAARRHAEEAGQGDSVFSLWRHIYAKQEAWAQGTPYPPLLWGFGVSLVERALIDGFCRASGTRFFQAVRTNTLGIDLGAIHAELAGRTPADFLPARPLRRITARHTVGLSDPLTGAEIAGADRVEDGLPQSLTASIRAYGLTHFKIKIGGDVEADLARLRQVASVIEEATAGGYAFTLDGNEQYGSVGSFRAFWQALTAVPELREFLEHLIFVEQPLHRDLALGSAVQTAFDNWPDRPPIIIDESDGTLSSASAALALGYSGTSHKNCKGVFKGIANTCLIRHRQQQDPARRFVISGEDLSNVGPVALLQDLAVLATLGIEHAERNGHHYFAGLSMWPDDVQQRVLAHHGDLYHSHDAESGRTFPTVTLQNGTLDTGSVVDAPFGLAFDLDATRFTPLARWRYGSLSSTNT